MTAKRKRFSPEQRQAYANEARITSPAAVAGRIGVAVETVRKWVRDYAPQGQQGGQPAATNGQAVSAAHSAASAPPDMSDDIPDIYGIMPFTSLHTGEAEARGGAVCDCGGFECPGVYGGICEYNDHTDPCPCDCGSSIQAEYGESFAYDRFGYCWGDEENPECLAASYPSANAEMFAGQKALSDGKVDLADFSMKLVEDEDDYHDAYGVELYYQGELVLNSRESEGDTYWVEGEAIAKAHGYMMRHAAKVAENLELAA